MNRRASIALMLALAACASLAPRLEAPKIVASSVRVVSVSLPDAPLAVELTLANPNAVDIALDAITTRVALEGEHVAAATLDRPVTLPANGEARVALSARGDAAAALASLGRALGAGRPLRYEIAGEARLADGTRLPFLRRGDTSGGRP